MKKIILLILITLNFDGFSQITLESQISATNDNTQFINTDNLGVKIVNLDRANAIVKIYNLDHSLYNSITIDYNSLNINNYPDNEGIYITAMTQHLFDNDDGIEFLLMIYFYNPSTNDGYPVSAIIDDNGSVLYTFNFLTPPYNIIEKFMPDPSWIIDTNNGVKMILVSDDSINIYGLPGTVSSITNTSRNSNSIFGYPNPTRNLINISYNLPQYCKSADLYLYTSENKLIKKYQINNNSNRIKINTNNLSSGIYYYRIVGNNYKSKTKRFIRIN